MGGKLYFYEEDASSRHTDALCLCVWITLRESNVVVAGNYSIRCDTWQTFTLATMEKRRHDIKILFSGGQGHFAEYWNYWKNKQMMQLSSRLTRQCAIYSILHEYNPTRKLLKTYPDRHQELCFYLCPTNVWNTNVQYSTKRTIKTHTSHKYANMYLVNGTTTLQEQVPSEAWRCELSVKLTRRWSFSPENCKYKFARPATKSHVMLDENFNR